MLIGIGGFFASLSWFYAFTLIQASFVRAVGQIELLFSYFSSKYLFKEKVKLTEILGIVVFVIGVTNSKAQNCDIPTNINTSNVSNFSATLNWDLDTLVHHYRLRYRPTGAPNWSYDHNIPQGNSYNLLGLVASTNYEWQLKSICSSGNSPSSSWTSLQTFTTTNFPVDCNNTPNGSAWIDSCGNCVGGNTGDVPCIPFSPDVSVSISNTDCDSLSSLTISVSQDPNEPDMSTSLFVSNVGSFNISNMNVGDINGSAVMNAGNGANTFNTELIVTTI